jgi:hypothetical protein
MLRVSKSNMPRFGTSPSYLGYIKSTELWYILKKVQIPARRTTKLAMITGDQIRIQTFLRSSFLVAVHNGRLTEAQKLLMRTQLKSKILQLLYEANTAEKMKFFMSNEQLAE